MFMEFEKLDSRMELPTRGPESSQDTKKDRKSSMADIQAISKQEQKNGKETIRSIDKMVLRVADSYSNPV